MHISINSTGFIVLLFHADDVYTLSMMVMFWAAVVFYMCKHTVEVYGTADKDTLPSTLASTVTSTALPTVLPTEDESIKLVVRMCLEVSPAAGKDFSVLYCSIKSQHKIDPMLLIVHDSFVHIF